MIGSILGNRYRVLRELGSGGMAWVYLAEDITESTYVAVKILYPQYSQDVAYLQRFVREARVAADLTDSHIVKVLDYGSSRDIHYIVMEYIAGLDLKAVLSERGRLTWTEALAITRQVALALAQASQFDVVHRDIKPQNLMIADDGSVKVLDFGIARMPTLPALTQSGLLGSPYYISPEQAMGEQVDARSDLYSLGVVLFEMLTGQAPFKADNPWSIISQHIADKPPRLSELVPDVPPGVEQILSIALAKDKEDRFASPDEMVQAIDIVLAGGTVPPRELLSCESPEEQERLLAELYDRAMGAVANEQYEDAIRDLSRILRFRSDYQDAEAQLSRVLGSFRLDELYGAAVRAIQDESWARALISLRELASSAPAYRDAEALLTQVQARLGTLSEPAAPERTEIPLSPEPTQVPTAAEITPDQMAEQPERVAPADTDGFVVLDYPVEAHDLEDLRSAKTGDVQLRPTARRPRWTLPVIAALIVLVGAAVYGYVVFAARPSLTLEERYQRAMASYNQGRWTDSVKEFERIMAIAPDYEDVAFRKSEAAKYRELDRLYSEGQTEYRQGRWAETITLLTQARAKDLMFKEASINSMLCDSYRQEALALSESTAPQSLQNTVALLSEGLDVCPANTEMLTLKKFAEDFIQASVEIEAGKYEESIDRLNALEAMDPSSTDERVGALLYEAYAKLGQQRESEGKPSEALEAYERAAAVPGIEHSAAEEHRIELAQQMAPATPTVLVAGAPTVRAAPTAARPTPRPMQQAVVKYAAPKPLEPEDGKSFTGGQFEKVILKWEGPEALAEGEYYDISILHFENGEPLYWGTNSLLSEVELPTDVGFGQADKDVFHWFVTIRQTQRVGEEGKPDGPAISPKSEAWTFTWR